MGLHCSDTLPCLFFGNLIEGEPPIYIGIYVDDTIYFSASDKVERYFESSLPTIGTVEFMGQVSHFLGIEFNWIHHTNGHVSVSLTQQSFAETLVESQNLTVTGTSTFITPYRSGLPIDAIIHQDMPSSDRDKLRLKYQSLVGSLNWLAHTTRPDLSMVVSLLAQHQSNPSTGHLEAARYAVKYLASTNTLGIYFTAQNILPWNPFCIFHLRIKFYLCPTQTGVHKMPHKQRILPNYLSLFLDQCRLFISICLVLYIGYQNIRR
jgi:hypothetical protein